MSSSRKMNLINPFPEHIKKIAILSLASRPDPAKIKKSCAAIGKLGIETILAPNTLKKGLGKVCPADVALRADDFFHCWHDKTVDLIISSRGGFGSAQVCGLIDWKKLPPRAVPVLGYSDITAFHLAMLKNKFGVPVCSPAATQLFDVCHNSISANSLKLALTMASETLSSRVIFLDLIPGQKAKKVKVLQPGKVSARLIPANLTVFCSLIGTPYMPSLTNSILMIEDVNEPLYKLERCLTQIEQSGILSKLSGLIFADFYRCDSAAKREKVFAEFAKKISGPVISGVPFGHIFPAFSFVVGKKTILEA